MARKKARSDEHEKKQELTARRTSGRRPKAKEHAETNALIPAKTQGAPDLVLPAYSTVFADMVLDDLPSLWLRIKRLIMESEDKVAVTAAIKLIDKLMPSIHMTQTSKDDGKARGGNILINIGGGLAPNAGSPTTFTVEVPPQE